ncbi:MAG: DUF1926 domain-containing protein [Treponema sp.]|nr:DUF1926 domain-containing protein [Treponema sp.]
MNDTKMYMILGSHAHVPSGADEKEYEFVYEKKMRPFITNLYRYSKIKAVLHYSGVLLYWVERTHPELFMLIEDMVTRKQAEILSGGFYEPMFPLIPLQDRIGQMELLTTYLRKHFGKRPAGCWISGMAWEQNLVSSLSASDMSYTFLSQDQFAQAGIQAEELFFPCISEDQGKLIIIFPVSLSMEKELTEKSFSQVFIEFSKKTEENYGYLPDRVISVFPENVSSAEEESPDTAWNRFLEEISLSENLIETVLPLKIIKSRKTFKKLSFPNSTSLDNFFSPRRYIIDYCEANGIYSKMIFTSVLINQIKGDKSRKQNAREELWKAQDHSLFTSGKWQHRSELRKEAYSSLIRAEKLSREKGKFISSLIQYDFDFDGKTEYLFQDTIMNCYIQTKGAGIFELDYIPKDWNYLDCSSAVLQGNVNDSRKISFADSILPAEIKMTGFEKDFPKNARLCFNEEYQALEQNKKGKSCFFLPSSDTNIEFASIEITKCYMLKKDILSVSYNLKNTGKESQAFNFVTEIDFSFAGIGDEYTRFYTIENNEKDIHVDKQMYNTDNLKILDVKNEVQIMLRSEKQFSGNLLHVCREGHYQTTGIIPFFSITLESAKTWTNEFTVKFSH